MISALKIFTLALMTVLVFGTISLSAFAEIESEYAFDYYPGSLKFDTNPEDMSCDSISPQPIIKTGSSLNIDGMDDYFFIVLGKTNSDNYHYLQIPLPDNNGKEHHESYILDFKKQDEVVYGGLYQDYSQLAVYLETNNVSLPIDENTYKRFFVGESKKITHQTDSIVPGDYDLHAILFQSDRSNWIKNEVCAISLNWPVSVDTNGNITTSEPQTQVGMIYPIDTDDTALAETDKIIEQVNQQSDTIEPSVSLDRIIYPVPFGGINDFEDTASSHPDGRSLFPVHQTAIHGNNMDASTTLGTGDLTLHIRINDANFDVSSQNEDKINKDILGKTVGPLKISVSRGSQTTVLAYAGGSTPNDDGLIDVGSNNPLTTRQIGPISEVSPDSGIFELDLAVRYTDGPFSTKCPATATFTSLDDDAVFGSEESRFDESSAEKENYCILEDDILTVEYTSIDESGNINVTTDSATFDLRNGMLEADKSVYIIGSDMILTLTDPDLDLDNDKAETYSLDLIEWDSDAATVTMGEFGGEISAFDPEPLHFRETGDSTGIFQIVVEIPQALKDDSLERGEEIILEYTDWGPSGAYHVGNEDEDINLTIYTSNFGATVELDKKMYDWNDKVYITVKAPDHNFDSDLIDAIGDNDSYPLKVSTRNSDLDNYKLVETGTNTGIFTGEVILVGYAGDMNSISTGKGPTDGMIPASRDDGVTVSFEFSEDETVVGSALIKSDRELSPLKQQSAGISPKDVVCNDGFFKIYKSSDSVSCVTLETREKLIERGWNEL